MIFLSNDLTIIVLFYLSKNHVKVILSLNKFTLVFTG